MKGEAHKYESSAREALVTIMEIGLEAITTKEAIKTGVELNETTLRVLDCTYQLEKEQALHVVGVGKCAIDAASELEVSLGDRLVGGVVVATNQNQWCELKKIQCLFGTHPYPTEINVEAAKKIRSYVESVPKTDFILFIISGGGSTLLCLPESGTCEDEEKLVKDLFTKGATIEEINTLRRHLSLVRGGWLTEYAYPTKGVALIFSDVPGNAIGAVASGPTVFDQSTVEEAEAVLLKYNVLASCGLDHCGLLETPKDESHFSTITNQLFITNETALSAMARQAARLGYKAQIQTNNLSGEVRAVAKRMAEDVARAPAGTVLLYGGETTVDLHGEHGQGGRNQALSLALLSYVEPGTFYLPFASDGWDNSDVAGAFADADTLTHFAEAGINLQTASIADVYTSFAKSGDQVKTGATGANVSDLIIALKA